jgi:hypothetical protein
VSTEDHQDAVASRARQGEQAAALVIGHGQIVAEYFDIGQSRTLSWARRPQAAALLAAMADPDCGFDAIVIGEYERAFCGSQYAAAEDGAQPGPPYPGAERRRYPLLVCVGSHAQPAPQRPGVDADHRGGDLGQSALHRATGLEPSAHPISTWSIRTTPHSAIGRSSGGTCPKGGSSPLAPPTQRWSARPTSSPSSR